MVSSVHFCARHLCAIHLVAAHVCASLTGCSPRPAEDDPAPAPAAEIARASFRAVGGRTIGNALTLGYAFGTTLALIADEDARAIRLVDVDSHRELDRVDVGGAPAQMVIGSDGRIYASLIDRARVVTLELMDEGSPALHLVAAVKVPQAPRGLAVADDTLLVASSWSAHVSAIDTRTGTVSWSVPVAKDPRAIAIAADGKKAWVTHGVGSRVSEVAMADGSVTTTSLAFSDGDGIAQLMTVAPLGEEIVAPGVVIHGGGDKRGGYASADGVPAHEAAWLSLTAGRVHDETGSWSLAEPMARRPTHDAACLLPRSSVSDETRVFVTCVGSDIVTGYDAPLDRPLSASRLGFMRVPAGPTGVAIDDREQVHVWSQFTQTLSSIPIARLGFDRAAQPDRITHLSSGTNAIGSIARRGRALFHASGDTRIARDGRACASCHPDGKDDSRSWPTPRGLRQTPMLIGRLRDSGPLGWGGEDASLQQHINHTLRSLGGRGLGDDDTHALSTYIDGLIAPPPTVATASHGRTLFFSDRLGCASCHRNGAGSDGARHDVGSGSAFETPSLRHLSQSAPYYHDGRFATLAALVDTTAGHMGWETALSQEERAALVSYLLTL